MSNEFLARDLFQENVQRIDLSGGGRSSAVDSFQRLRVSEPFTLFDSDLVEKQDNAAWETVLFGTGTFAFGTTSPIGILTTTNVGDRVIRQQHGYNHYIPGRSIVCDFTFNMRTPVADLVKRVGYYDDADGVYLEQNGVNGWVLVLRSSVGGSITERRVPQSQWSGDRLNGSGDYYTNPSGLNLELAAAQLFVLDLKWLSVGEVRAFININNNLILIHQFFNANILTGPYMFSADLPVRYEIIQNGATGGSLDQICVMVSNEGGFDRFGSIHSIDHGVTSKTINNGLRQSIISFRMRQFLESGVVNRRVAIPINMSLQTEALQDAKLHVELVLQSQADGTPVFGGTPTWTTRPLSGLEWTQGVTTVGPGTGPGGRVMASQYIDAIKQQGLNGLSADLFTIQFTPISTLLMARNWNNSNSDYLHLIATPIGSNVSFWGSVSFREVF